MDLDRINPAERGWCIFEWDATIMCHGIEKLHMPLTKEERLKIVSIICVEKASCYYESDKEMILRKVLEHHGSTDAFDRSLKRMLLFDELKYTVDLSELLRRQKGTDYNYDKVQQWLDGDKAVMCIVGGAGTGKSTISAAIVE